MVGPNDTPSGDQRNWTPRPDPTELTTEALHREIRKLRELMFERINRTVEVSEEKFDSVSDKLTLVENQRVEQKKDTKDAVDAALTAQKEAVSEQTTASERSIAKSEGATTKSIEQLGAKFDTALEGQRRDIDDLKGRINTVEAVKTGSKEASGSLATVIGLAIGASAVLTAIVTYAASH